MRELDSCLRRSESAFLYEWKQKRSIRSLILRIINLFEIFAKDSDLLRIWIEADFRSMGCVKVEVEEGFGFGEICELMRAFFAYREKDGVASGYFLLAFWRAENPFAAEDEEAFFIACVIIVGEACFLWRQLNQRGNAALHKWTDLTTLYV